VLIAHLLLTHLALREPDVQAAIEDHSSLLRLPSIPQLQQTLRAMLLEDILQRLEKRRCQRGIARKIKEILNMDPPFRRSAFQFLRISVLGGFDEGALGACGN